ncbi:MAG: YnbE family lipoprotein [Sphingomicrobium sp.]
MMRTRVPALAAAAVLLLPLGGCISVKTPDKPIEINLNVNIKQEVLVRLQRDVETLINQNPDAFPQAPAPVPQKKP